jgi:siroheme synthase
VNDSDKRRNPAFVTERATGAIRRQREAGFFTVSYAARALNVSADTLVSLMDAGQLAYEIVQQGNHRSRRITATTLADLAQRMGLSWTPPVPDESDHATPTLP